MQLSFRDWVLLSQLVAGGVLLEILLRLVSLPRLVQALSWGSRSRVGAAVPFFHRHATDQKLSDLAALAARIVRGPDCCLPRSLLLFWLLSVRREPVTLLVGVHKESGKFRAHAWVKTQEGLGVDGHQDGAVFQPMVRFSSEEI